MMIGKAFKPRSHYVFDYKPRYYNERKERIEKLKQKYAGEDEQDGEVTKISLSKNNLKSDWIRNKKHASNRGATIRLAVIITILVVLAIYTFDLHTLF